VTHAGKPFTPEDTPSPEDNYALSKWEAEKGLMDLGLKAKMEIVIIRPPLVYGANAKGNFSKLMSLAGMKLPLPFGSIKNQRSLVSIDNLVDLIHKCISHPLAKNQVFLVSDGKDLSTTELLKLIANAGGKNLNMISIPPFVFILIISLLGKRHLANRFFGSLHVDISKTRDLLDWNPPVSVEEALSRCYKFKQ